MKEEITIPGKTYAVTSSAGCTVTTEDGLTLADVEAGKQGYFVAVGGKVIVDDDAVIVTEVFKLAPWQKLALLGVLGGGEPAWLKALREELTAMLDGSAFELAWLAGTKQLIVHTDRVDDAMLAAVKATAEAAMPEGATLVQYNHHIEVSWRDIGKYDKVRTSTELQTMTTKTAFQNDLTSDGWWVYPMSAFSDYAGAYFFNWFRNNPNLKVAHIFLPKVMSFQEGVGYNKNLVELVCTLAETTNEGVFARNTSMRKLKFHCKKKLNFSNLCNYCTKLSEVDITWDEGAKVSGGAGGFSGCILNKASVIRLLNSLPEMAGQSITMGMHVDNKNDEEVRAAIDAAAAKGWSVSEQWNGTATATTFALRPAPKPPVYAKESTWTDGLGNEHRSLEWCHQITSPDGKEPEELGYEYFDSVEDASAWFNLPEPEENLTETE